MSTPLFSVNGAAEALERDRRTITKALRHTKPDGKQHGQDRWRLKTILAALEELPGSSTSPRRRRSNDNNGERWADPRVTELTDDFVAAIEALNAMPLQQRREVAKTKLGPQLSEVNRLLIKYGLENNPGQDELVGYRAESIWRTCFMWIKHLCNWPYEEAWGVLITANYEDEDD